MPPGRRTRCRCNGARNPALKLLEFGGDPIQSERARFRQSVFHELPCPLAITGSASAQQHVRIPLARPQTPVLSAELGVARQRCLEVSLGQLESPHHRREGCEVTVDAADCGASSPGDHVAIRERLNQLVEDSCTVGVLKVTARYGKQVHTREPEEVARNPGEVVASQPVELSTCLLR
jgi:hypothetical protein